MDLPAGTEGTGYAGGRPRGSAGRRVARSHSRFTAAVAMVFVAAFTATNVSAVRPAPAGPSAIGAARVSGAASTRVRASGTARAGAQSAAYGTRSGLPWLSGAFLASQTPGAASTFAAWRHRRLDLAVLWPNEGTWAAITDPFWLYRRWKRAHTPMVLSEPMLPTHVPGVSIRACANGAYRAHWRLFGRVIRASGLGSSIIRLGWEFNGAWFPWAATQPRTWAECWRQIVTAARSTAPHLRWDWNVNRGVSSALANPARAYPGNAYVSMVGIDSYDWWPPATTAAGWNKQLNGKQGLNYWLAFAKAHGKKLSVPEWGNARYGASAGGDDPQYVRDMKAFFAANARYLAYEAVCQSPLGAYVYGRFMPRAAAAYRNRF